MNLLCAIRHPQMTYSLVQYNSSQHLKRPSALFIGDSFYFTWSDAGYISNVFRNREFWYYGYHVYYGSFDSGHRTAREDVLSAVLRQDVIVILQTCAGYGNIGYDFVDRLLHALDF
jgi:hypothetical protein